MLVRWTPFNDMARLHDEVERLFDKAPAAWNPAFDITEDADKIVLHADLPGVEQKAVDIQVEHNTLTVKGERSIQRTETQNGELYRRYERLAGAFARSFRLPPTVDAEKISAAIKDGVLTVLLPKKAEAQPRQIKVSVQ
jgi:HSP20 family protein